MLLQKSPMETLYLYLDSKFKLYEQNEKKIFKFVIFSSSLIMRILETAIRRGIDFRVIIVDSRPQQHGRILFFQKYSNLYK